MKAMEKVFSMLAPGGHGEPRNCRARHRIAIIVPYRNRPLHRRLFLYNMHQWLPKQMLDYMVIIISQLGKEKFNRGALMNIGFVEAQKLYDWECFIFHDIDLLPENDRIPYRCLDQPLHLSAAMSKYNYSIPYKKYFGGICAFTKEQFLRMNGFSNDYWGWGGEDDDAHNRVLLAGYSISRYPKSLARYTMLPHANQAGTSNASNCYTPSINETLSKWKKSGLSSLNYHLYSIKFLPLYLSIQVTLMDKGQERLLQNSSDC
ncbi:unnamed protein product [Dracunculus medinensis]|uniref:Beta-1,4-galactosyltransferase 1-like n=1 Tax=Dracunculus medinensis TaxID=318479 RepID=A0A0N4U6A0_DRAME|nr:unnamed protein product [Dracunculus medinensis]